MRVESWMTRDPITVEESTPLREAWHVFWSRRIRHLPVVRGLVLVGILSERDLRDRVWPRRHDPGPEPFGLVCDAMTRGVITARSG